MVQSVAKMMKPTSDNPKIKSHAGETRTQQTRHKRSEKHKAKQTEQDDGKRHETKPRQKQSPRAANNRRRKLREEGFRLFRFPKERTRTARGREGPEPVERPKRARRTPKAETVFFCSGQSSSGSAKVVLF